MALLRLCVALSAIGVASVFSQDETDFANPPPLPETGVRLFLGIHNTTFPNYGMIAARDFAERDGGAGMPLIGLLDGLNDGLWCQSASDSENIGSWKFPDGSDVPDNLDADPIHMAHRPGQVGLLRAGSIGGVQGMYTCTIPDENGIMQTLVVWAAGTNAYDAAPGPTVTEMAFIPSTKPRDTDPPELILSFDVVTAPPTYVTCQLGSTPVDVAVLSRELTSGEYIPSSTLPMTNVNVTLRTRQAGNYQCTVSVARASGSDLSDATTSPISISVTDTPKDVQGMRTGSHTVQLSWSAPTNSTPTVAGYEVFYAVSGIGSAQSGGTTTNTNTTVTVTLLGVTYDFFIVAFSDESNVLPSAPSSNNTIELSVPELVPPVNVTSTNESIAVSWKTPEYSPTGYILTADCMRLCGDAIPESTINVTNASSTSATFSDKPPWSACSITLTAQYSSSSSNELMVTGTTSSEKPSASPTGFAVVSVSSSSVTLTWEEIACSDRNGPNLVYVVQYTPDSGMSSTKLFTENNQQLGALTACTNYTLRIAASNDEGMSDFSLPVSVVTNGTVVPGMVVFNLIVPTFTSITFSWDPVSDVNGVVQYQIQFTKNGSSTTESTTALMYVLEDLIPSTEVNFFVTAVSICGLVGETSHTTANTEAIPMTSKFSTEKINNTAVLAMWTAVNDPYLDRYTVYYYPDPDQSGRRKRQAINEQNAIFPAGSSSGVIGGLEEGQNYLFSLAVTFNISGQVFEGERTEPAPPGVEVTQTPPPSSISDSTTSETTTEPLSNSDNTPVIAGAVVVVLLVVIVIIVVVVIVIVLRKRRQTKAKHYDVGYQQQKPVHFSKSPEIGEEVKLTTVPVIESFPSTMMVEEGQRVELKVFVNGIPKPSYQWFHDGQPVEKDYAHDVTEDGCLILVTAERKHNGKYKLVAENVAGVAEKTVVLTVMQEKMDEDTAPVTVNGDSNTVPAHPSLDPIPVAEFGQYVANSHADNNKGFRGLYSSLAGKEGEHPVTVAITPTNKPMNRFANITVYDDNRIILKPIAGRSDCQGDYINASYVDGYNLPHKYIATQGPMNKTLVDFWRLVWQEKPQTIVMVTNLKEEKKVKCQLYWPETGSQDFGPFRITLADQQVFTDYVIRLLQVELSGSSEYPHRVTQYHFTSWPDHGVPEYATPILTLHRQTKQNHKPKRGPMLVHCSAGIGRTGTFMAIDMALEKVESEAVVDIANIIIQMRQQRMKMVQTVDQFIFICDAILESITCGDTQIPTASLRAALSKLRTVDPHIGKTGFQQQFDVLTQVTPNPIEVKHDVASRYPDLNRTLEFAPPDKHRVPLKGSSHDYINATFVNGYKQKKAFIVAQSPMDSTCKDFWKMVVQRGCSVIIMLCHTQENGKEVCTQYWPSSGENKVFGEFLVEIQDEVSYPGFVERTLVVTEKASGKPHKVIQFHVSNWACPGRCSNLQTIVSVQEEMYKVQRRTGNNPVVVHCSNTVGRSGMFCAIATAIDRCKTEGLVDVFQVVKAQRIQKPGLVQDVAQYELVFEAILAFLDSFETYTNFQ